MHQRLTLLVAAVAVIASACSAGEPAGSSREASDDATTTTRAVAPSTLPAAEPTPSSAPSTTQSDESDPVLVGGIDERVVDFVAAIDELLVNSEMQAALAEDPEVFVATGRLFCEKLTEGTPPVVMLSDYVEALTGGSIEDADVASVDLAGWLLGSAVGYLCPEHTDMIEQSL